MAHEPNPLATYLRTRRDSLQPADVGLPATAGRRVSGLRREEVAELAGISADYYVRIEQGRDQHPSDQVLSALARALRLDDDARDYFFRLARPGSQTMRSHPLSESVLRLLDYWSHTPAYLFDRNHDVLAANQLMRALSPEVQPGHNQLIDAFGGYARAIDEEQPAAVLEGWESILNQMLAALRFSSDPHDPRLHEVVGYLSTTYRSFRPLWARHEARPHTGGTLHVHVDPIGWVEFRWQALEVSNAPGQYLVTYLVEPDTHAAAAIAYLVSIRRPGASDFRSDEPSPDA
ncbi:helix-turn-helix transcriptional regulator [Salinibacterium sp. NYA9b]